MIYQIDYISDQLRVKGYLGFPPDTAIDTIKAMLQHIQRMDQVCVMNTLACSLHHRPASGDLHKDTASLPNSDAGACPVQASDLDTRHDAPRTLDLQSADGLAYGHHDQSGTNHGENIPDTGQPGVAGLVADTSIAGSQVISSPGKVKFPLIIYCRGGIGRVGAVKLKWIEEFAAQGYIVFAPAYRGNEGSQGRDEFGGSDTHDVLTAIHWLSQLPWIDSARMHMLGFSRGAINAAQAAVRCSHISRLILWSGVSDLTQTYEERIDLRRMMKRVIGGTPNKVPDKYRQRSPLHLAEQLRCPVLLVHGTSDELVAIEHSHRMLHRLKELRYHVDAHFYLGLRHHFPALQHAAAIERMFDWLKSPVPYP